MSSPFEVLLICLRKVFMIFQTCGIRNYIGSRRRMRFDAQRLQWRIYSKHFFMLRIESFVRSPLLSPCPCNFMDVLFLFAGSFSLWSLQFLIQFWRQVMSSP